MNKEGEYWDVEKPGCLSEGKESTFQKENMKLSRQKKLIEINDAQRVIYAVIWYIEPVWWSGRVRSVCVCVRLPQFLKQQQ